MIDDGDAFVFGYSKLDVMFGRTGLESVRLPYSDFAKPGVRFLAETITEIDPDARRVTTECRRARGRRPRRGSRRRLRLRRDARARGGRERVLLRGRRGAAPGGAPDVHAWPRDRGRLRRAVQVPARAERGGAPPSRLPRRARRARRLRDLARDAVLDPGSAVARHLRRAARSVRRAGHRVRPGTQGRRSRRGACGRGPRGRHRAAVRPLSRCSQAPRAGRRPRERDGRGRVHPGRTRERSRRAFRASTRSATSRRRASRRRASSRRAPHAWWRRRSSRGSGEARSRTRTTDEARATSSSARGRVGRVDVDFLSGPTPTGTFREPSPEVRAEKEHFGASRRARWFDR